ncbi:hypothetical protein [Haloplanus halobius]|uniref:hypothetical protein n=1 Tax=Haloplanus halobius TaxID=2934938 RepID=UPI00200F3CF1|nr:hypothetical protein [Haloplanus sp. XH21]
MAPSFSSIAVQGRLGRIYLPPIAVLYLYSITANPLYGYLSFGGVIAAVSLHAQNYAVFGPKGMLGNPQAQDEKFARRLATILKRGRLEDYPQSVTELLKNPFDLPLDAKRLPVVCLSFFSGWMIMANILGAAWGFWNHYSSLEFVGLTILFAMAVFLLQPVLWPMYWSVSNQRDNRHPAVDTPDHRRIEDLSDILEAKGDVRVKKNEYAIEEGGKLTLVCEAQYTESDTIQVLVQGISFAYAGLFESTSLPHSELYAKIIDANENTITFTGPCLDGETRSVWRLYY